MMFDELTKNKIILGKKIVTRRVVRNNRRPAVPGEIHKIKIDRTPRVYGFIKIKSCHQEKLKEITGIDALKEGFSSVKSYLEYFMRVNNIKNLDTMVWVIEFEYLKNGVEE